MNIKNCAIYTRVSTDNQAEKEFSSCEAQEQKIRSFIASQNDWQVFKIYNDARFSGAILERPAFQEILSYFKKKKNCSPQKNKNPLHPPPKGGLRPREAKPSPATGGAGRANPLNFKI